MLERWTVHAVEVIDRTELGSGIAALREPQIAVTAAARAPRVEIQREPVEAEQRRTIAEARGEAPEQAERGELGAAGSARRKEDALRRELRIRGAEQREAVARQRRRPEIEVCI